MWETLPCVHHTIFCSWAHRDTRLPAQLPLPFDSCSVTEPLTLQKKLPSLALKHSLFLPQPSSLPWQVWSVGVPDGHPMRWRRADRCLRLWVEREINIFCVGPLRFHILLVTAAWLILSWLSSYPCLARDSTPTPKAQCISFFCISCSTKDNVKLSATHPHKNLLAGMWLMRVMTIPG